MWAGLSGDCPSLPHLESAGQLKIWEVKETKGLLTLLYGAPAGKRQAAEDWNVWDSSITMSSHHMISPT